MCECMTVPFIFYVKKNQSDTDWDGWDVYADEHNVENKDRLKWNENNGVQWSNGNETEKQKQQQQKQYKWSDIYKSKKKKQ